MADKLQGIWVFDKNTYNYDTYQEAEWNVNFISKGVQYSRLKIASADFVNGNYSTNSTVAIYYDGSRKWGNGYGWYEGLDTIQITSRYDEVENADTLLQALTARASFTPNTDGDIKVPMTSAKGVVLKTAGKLCDTDIVVTPTFEIHEAPNIQPLTITENGTYTASGDVDGYSPITVEVAASGGGSDAELYFEGGYAEVNLPNATKIKQYAFYQDAVVTNVSIPKAAQVNIRAFYNCTNLKSVSMPKVTSIELGAFRGCSQLASVEMPEVTSVGEAAFYGCKLQGQLTLSKATSIGKEAFYGCKQLTKLTLPEVTSIGASAFSYLNLAEVYFPKVSTIGEQAFRGCKFTSLLFPSVLKTIGPAAFNGITTLVSITFEGTPTSINSTAFGSCTTLTTINVPWAEGAVANAPWGATNATINYNYTGG